MKNLLLTVLLLTFATVSFAQPKSASDDRKLQNDLRKLTRRVETLKNLETSSVNKRNENRVRRAIEAAETELASFKQKHPKYDVSSFEKDITDFKNKQEKALENKEVDAKNIDGFVATLEEILDFRPPVTSFLSKQDGITGKTEQQLKVFQTKTEQTLTPEFLALAKDSTNRQIRNISNKVRRMVTSDAGRLSSVDTKSIREETEENLMLAKYFDVLFTQKRLATLNKIFVNETEIQTALESSNTIINELGSLAQMQTLARKNYAAKVAKARMYPEVQNNQALRNRFINAFKSSVYRNGDISENSTILKVHLVSSGWSVKRNEITGIILSRDQQGDIAFKATNGKCYTYLMILEQKHLGGGKYSNGIDRSGSQSEILCENVPK